MRRRTFVSVSSLALIGAVAGCADNDDWAGEPDDDTGAESPAAAVRSYFSAFDDGAEDRLDAILHEESPERPVEDLIPRRPSVNAISIEESTVVERADGTAIVEVVLRWVVDDAIDYHAGEVEVRKTAGAWQYWDRDLDRVPNDEYPELGVEFDSENGRVVSLNSDDALDLTVVTHRGEPVSDVTVRLAPGSETEGETIERTTDADGNITVAGFIETANVTLGEDVKSGTYLVDLIPPADSDYLDVRGNGPISIVDSRDS